jgi:hypothetical protein
MFNFIFILFCFLILFRIGELILELHFFYLQFLQIITDFIYEIFMKIYARRLSHLKRGAYIQSISWKPSTLAVSGSVADTDPVKAQTFLVGSGSSRLKPAPDTGLSK